MKRIILSILLLSLFASPAQELVRSDNANQKKTETNKYSEQIQAIVDSYDQDKLGLLKREFTQRSIRNKSEVKSYALLYNIPIRFEKEDGTLVELQFITTDGTPVYFTTFNVDAAISTRANYLNTGGGLGLNLNGDDLVAHVWDAGLARSTHQEYDGAGGTNRFSIGDGTSALHFHSAHVTGTIMASGVQAAAKGMAWQADAVGYDWNSDTSEATTAAAGGMLISNHSYGYIASGIPNSWFGQYGQDARDWDGIMYNAPYYLMMVAAGNDGNDNSSNAAPLDGESAYDKLSGHATSKNNLVVANGQDANIDGSGNLISVTRNSSSSEGPTDDYRIKPDIMGNGTGLYSTYQNSNTAYNSISGTSMASPNVAGTLLLLQEHYFNVNGSLMRAATLKGLALHTADDTAANGPDAQTGWGLLNAKAAAETISAAPVSAIVSELNLSQGATYQVTIQSDGVNPLLASISWTDPAGTVNNGTNSNTPALVNDLDIRLDNGTTFTPWRLTGVTTNGTGDNNVDPFERIDISSASGQYTLTVTHKGTLSSGSQNFSLIVTGGTIAATSPEISYGTTTSTTTEATDCNFTDVTVPLNIAMAPSQDADVTFNVAGGTATVGLDFEILTPTVTFLQGQTASQNLTVRFYNEGFIESTETAIIDFIVNPNGGDATANTNADSLTITINDDDAAPVSTTDITVLSEDFEDWTGWLQGDRDGDGNIWLSLSFTSGGFTGFTGQFAASETDLTVLGGTGSANADNYLISPQMTIPVTTTNTAFTFSVAGFNTIEHYRLIWTTDISTYATIDAGITLEERDATANIGDIRTINNATLAGQTGYFVIRHFNSSANNGLLLFDALDIVATIETPVQTAVNNGSTNDLVDLPGMGTMYAFDSASDYVMAAITNNNTDDYGCVDISVSRAGTGAQAYNGSSSPDFVTDKTFLIAPTNTQAAGDTSVMFYFSEAEIAGWESATGLSRSSLIAARGTSTVVTETSTLTIGSFGTNVTLSGYFTGLDGTFYFGPLGAFTACSGTTKTWDGANWSPVGAPTINDPVIINGNYTTTTDGDLNACALIINNPHVLTVNTGGLLNVDGTMLVDGSLIIEHQGSVVQTDPDAFVTKNPDTGVINVQLTTPVLQTRDFMVMGSPMDSETRTGVYNSSFLVLQHTPGNFIPHAGVPSGGTNFADDNGDFWNQFASGPINVAEGYIVRPQSSYTDPANTTYSMTYSLGTLNNGSLSRPITYNGAGPNPDGTPNVLANPYASAISASLFINDVSNSLVNEVYFWEHLTPPNASTPGAGNINFSMDDISMYNGTMGIPAANDPGTSTTPNGVISTGQGFGIKAFGVGTVIFRNSMRLTSGNTTLRTPEGLEKLILKVQNNEYELGSYTGIAFSQDGTPYLDSKFDSNRIATFISLFSHLEDGSEQLGIQTRESFSNGIKIPMGFASQVDAEVFYSISIATIEGDNLSNATIYLVDNLEETITDLTQGDYHFMSNKGTFDGRFTLQFEYEVLGTNDADLENITVYPNPTQSILNIVSPNAQITGVVVYDVQGRKVDAVSVNNQTTYQLDMSKLVSSLYFITISTDNGSVVKRIVKK